MYVAMDAAAPVRSPPLLPQRTSDMARPPIERLVVPLEDVLALCTAASLPDAPLPSSLRELLCFLLQRHDLSDAALNCLRPAAVAWLICLCPDLSRLDWAAAEHAAGGEALHAAARRLLAADAVSLVPLQGALRQLAHAHADYWEEHLRNAQALVRETARLTGRLAELEPVAAELLREQRKLEAAQAEVRQTRSSLRAAEDELAQLRRQVEHLQHTARPEALHPDAAPVSTEEEFGFGSRPTDNQGFGF